MALLFFPKLLARWSQTCILERNPNCTEALRRLKLVTQWSEFVTLEVHGSLIAVVELTGKTRL